jgi:hypothetical protein
MKLTKIFILNEELKEFLIVLNNHNESKAIALSNIEHWSSHEDLFGNLEQAMMRIKTIDSEIEITTNQIKEIINQLCIIQNQ